MNGEGLKRLLRTRNHAKDTAVFGLAQYERGRIFFRVMTDVLQERFLISRDLTEFVCMLVWDLIQYASTKAPIAIR
jgi:hypothetical protein